MTNPDLYSSQEGGWRRAFQRSRFYAWMVHKGWISGVERLPPNPELAFSFLAQRMVKDWPIGDARTGTGYVVALLRACDPALAAESTMLLAKALATESGRNVVMVDADIEDNLLTQKFDRGEQTGLVDALVGDGSIAPGGRFETAVENVEFVGRGNVALLPDSLTDEQVARAFTSLRKSSGHTLVQMSRAGFDSRNIPIVTAADMVIIVAEEGGTFLPEIEQAETLLAVNGIHDPKLLLAQHRPARSTTWLQSA